eukprot:6555136-Prymnesium_polylepis.1
MAGCYSLLISKCTEVVVDTCAPWFCPSGLCKTSRNKDRRESFRRASHVLANACARRMQCTQQQNTTCNTQCYTASFVLSLCYG